MRCYVVEAGGLKKYAGTQAEARQVKAELAVRASIKEREVTVTETDVPLAKADLLAFINELQERANVAVPVVAPEPGQS